jgi:hypothetical protein
MTCSSPARSRKKNIKHQMVGALSRTLHLVKELMSYEFG